jgi:hypothetical protein
MTREEHGRFLGAYETIRNTERDLGTVSLAVGLGIVTWTDGSSERRAPLLVVPVRLHRRGDEHILVGAGEIVLNPALLARVGTGAEAFPDDPLDYRPRLADPIVRVEDAAVIGQFSLARHEMFARTDPEVNPRITTASALAGLTSAARTTPPGPIGADDPDLPLDHDQAGAYGRILTGDNTIVSGGPGTGKAQIATAALIALCKAGRRVLVIGETMPTLARLYDRVTRYANTPPLALWSPDQVDRYAEESGRRPAPTALQILRGLSRAQRPNLIITTPLGYVTTVPGEWRFDTVVVMDARRVALDQAALAMSSSDQCVVFGDEHQGVPSDVARRAFDTQITTLKRESVLEGAARAGWLKTGLSRAYRQRHHDLVSLVNRHVYRPALDMPRAVGSTPRRGVSVHQVGGLFDRRANEINVIEAETVAAEALRACAVDDARTVIVIAMTRGQADRIRDEIAHIAPSVSIRADRIRTLTPPECHGEIADEVLISLTYGPDRREGPMPKAFGAISITDGDRLLSCVMTRSRYATRVYASVPSEMIPRNRGRGHEMLITLLKGSDAGSQPVGYQGGAASLIESLGCVAHQTGRILYLSETTGRPIGAFVLLSEPADRDGLCDLERLTHLGWRAQPVSGRDLETATADNEAGRTVQAMIAKMREGA